VAHSTTPSQVDIDLNTHNPEVKNEEQYTRRISREGLSVWKARMSSFINAFIYLPLSTTIRHCTPNRLFQHKHAGTVARAQQSDTNELQEPRDKNGRRTARSCRIAITEYLRRAAGGESVKTVDVTCLPLGSGITFCGWMPCLCDLCLWWHTVMILGRDSFHTHVSCF
jgi:hypothetical protein